MEFTYEFEKGERCIYFAHSMPYTYSMLCEYLNKNVTKEKAKRQTLCHSLAGNKVEYLLITSKKKCDQAQVQENENSISQRGLKEKDGGASPSKLPLKKQKSIPKKNRKSIANEPKEIEKQVIVLTSRVHPGETNASWMIQGLMEVLLNPSGREEEELAKNLKDHFEIYIIPMLNVDGVVNGNYRCSLAACDLNRRYAKPSKVLHPPVYYTKQLTTHIMEMEKKQFFLYLDFHGHSAKKNIFQYGNKVESWAPMKNKGVPVHQTSVFPLILSKQFDYFNFQNCAFTMPKSKEATARITMFHKLRIPFVFTLEASFAGASKGSLAGKHFSQKDLTNVGKYVLQAIWQTKKLELNKNLLKQINEEANSHIKQSNEEVDDESEGCSSSEEEAQPPTSNNQKVMQIIQEQESPNPTTKRQLEGAGQLTTGNVTTIVQSPIAAVNNAAPTLQSRQKSRGPGPSNAAAPGGVPQQPAKGGKQHQLKNIINLKAVTCTNPSNGAGKGSSPRKHECQSNNRPDKYIPTMGQQVRRSLARQELNDQSLNNSQNRMVESQEGNNDNENNKMIQGKQGENYDHSPPPIKASNKLTQRYSSNGGGQFANTDQLPQPLQRDTATFDLFKNLIKTEPDLNSDKSAFNRNEQKKQQFIQQFNNEIEKSFHEQQQYLDEIFKQKAKQFFEQKGNSIPNNSNYAPPYTQPKKHHKQLQNMPQEDTPNWHLDQFLNQQRQNQKKSKQNNKFSDSSNYENLHSQNSAFDLSQNSHSAAATPQAQPAQFETFMQLQKLHQMQKLNQIAQMQFFRQQAELLLSQNLSQKQQLELFQQFSYYQAQIQMQNSQYQIMLNQSLHGNNMNYLSNFKDTNEGDYTYSKKYTNKTHQRKGTDFMAQATTLCSNNSPTPLTITNLANYALKDEAQSSFVNRNDVVPHHKKSASHKHRGLSYGGNQAYGSYSQKYKQPSIKLNDDIPSSDLFEDYLSPNSSQSKITQARHTRNSVAILNSKKSENAQQTGQTIVKNFILSPNINIEPEPQDPNRPSGGQFKGKNPISLRMQPEDRDRFGNIQKYANSFQRSQATNSGNKTHAQAVLKVKRGLIDFKSGTSNEQGGWSNLSQNFNSTTVPAQQQSFHRQNRENVPYTQGQKPELQSFSQILNQQLQDSRGFQGQFQQALQNQNQYIAQSKKVKEPTEQGKFFSTRHSRFNQNQAMHHPSNQQMQNVSSEFVSQDSKFQISQSKNNSFNVGMTQLGSFAQQKQPDRPSSRQFMQKSKGDLPSASASSSQQCPYIGGARQQQSQYGDATIQNAYHHSATLTNKQKVENILYSSEQPSAQKHLPDANKLDKYMNTRRDALNSERPQNPRERLPRQSQPTYLTQQNSKPAIQQAKPTNRSEAFYNLNTPVLQGRNQQSKVSAKQTLAIQSPPVGTDETEEPQDPK